MHDVYRVCRLESSHTSKQNFLSLILLIPLPKLMNQKRDVCRCYILYPLRLGPPFPNDAKILRPKVGLGPNQMLIDLRNVKMENITFYEQINYFWKIKGHGNPRLVHGSTYLRTQGQMHAYVGTNHACKVPETEKQIFYIKVKARNVSHII